MKKKANRSIRCPASAMLKSRRQDLQQLYADVFDGRTGHMPMIVSVPRPGAGGRPAWRTDPGGTARAAGEAVAADPAVGDWIPSVNIGVYQCIVVPSLFGASITDVPGSDSICHQCFDSVDAALAAGTPPLDGPIVEEMLACMRTVQANLPDDMALSFPACASPFDLAQLMLGEQFIFALIDTPDKSAEFLSNLTRLFIDVTKLVKGELGDPLRETITNRGIPFPGMRVPSDSIVNYSPDILKQFAVPVYDQIAAELGPICLHYCTAPAPCSHVLPAMLECSSLKAVDNWQGPDIFLGADSPAAEQDRVAVISDFPAGTPEELDALLETTPFKDIPRKGGRGIVVNVKSSTRDEAQHLYDHWQSLMP